MIELPNAGQSTFSELPSTSHFPTILTVAEVAEQLRVSVHTVRNWIKAGKLTPIRLGGTTHAKVSVEELRRFVGIDG